MGIDICRCKEQLGEENETNETNVVYSYKI